MLDSILGRVFSSEWQVLLFVSLLLVGATEAGFRYGLRLYRAKDKPRIGQISGIQGALLGLLGLLLGFTFAIAEGRYEIRRGLVIQEANAIGTTYLRASLLPEPHNREIETLLRDYVDVRLDFYFAGEDSSKINAAEQEAARIQHKLWAHAVAAAQAAPTPITATFISVLNETIDLDAARLQAFRSRVPVAVWLLVLVVAFCGCLITGIRAGTSTERSVFASALLPVLIAVAIMLISDLDRPRIGLVRIDQQSLIDLKQTFQPRQP